MIFQTVKYCSIWCRYSQTTTIHTLFYFIIFHFQIEYICLNSSLQLTASWIFLNCMCVCLYVCMFMMTRSAPKSTVCYLDMHTISAPHFSVLNRRIFEHPGKMESFHPPSFYTPATDVSTQKTSFDCIIDAIFVFALVKWKTNRGRFEMIILVYI